jgi:hypothetical protein
MVLIKVGTFLRIKYPVTLTRDYWLGKYEVTQGEYMALMGKNPSHFTGDTNRPVEKLTWFEAAAYCQELTRREQQAGHLQPGYVYRLGICLRGRHHESFQFRGFGYQCGSICLDYGE